MKIVTTNSENGNVVPLACTCTQFFSDWEADHHTECVCRCDGLMGDSDTKLDQHWVQAP